MSIDATLGVNVTTRPWLVVVTGLLSVTVVPEMDATAALVAMPPLVAVTTSPTLMDEATEVLFT